MSGVLLLDQSYRPLDIISYEDAAEKLVTHKAFPVPGATIVATYRSPSLTVHIPKILCLKIYVPVPKNLSRHITNRLLFARDDYTCQYCGRHKRDFKKHEKLTRDHVKPICKFSGATRAAKAEKANTWDNVSTACTTCNSKKGDSLPYEVKMYPKTTPKRPYGLLITIIDRLDEEQLEFVKPFLPAIA